MKPETKAELIAVGSLDIEPSLLGKITVPTAGPGAGKTAFFFRSGDQRVRLALNKDSPLKAVAEGDEIVITRDGKEIARGEIEEELIHCPDQAYINMTEKCIFDCKFCPVPKLNGKVKTIEEVVTLIGEANATGKMKAISITTGVDESVEKELE
ncbi:MAG: radical SAM protein, partial [Methanosarcinales archaeon]|nr:radical SAM protein [Methanosarcinales archaeon]